MENSMDQNELNLYKYSDVDLVNFIKGKNAENNKKTDPESIKKNEFLIELAMFLEKKLKHIISLHQNGFKIYKQKLLADKAFIQNSIRKEIRSLTINQLIQLLINIKNESVPKNTNKYFNIGQKIVQNINVNSIDILNNIFSQTNIQNNGKDINNNKLNFNNTNVNNLNSNNVFNKINNGNKARNI